MTLIAHGGCGQGCGQGRETSVSAVETAFDSSLVSSLPRTQTGCARSQLWSCCRKSTSSQSLDQSKVGRLSPYRESALTSSHIMYLSRLCCSPSMYTHTHIHTHTLTHPPPPPTHTHIHVAGSRVSKQSHRTLGDFSFSTLGQPETAVEKLAYRFNQVCSIPPYLKWLVPDYSMTIT